MATIRPEMKLWLPTPASPEEPSPVSQSSAPPWPSRQLSSFTSWSKWLKSDSMVPLQFSLYILLQLATSFLHVFFSYSSSRSVSQARTCSCVVSEMSDFRMLHDVRSRMPCAQLAASPICNCLQHWLLKRVYRSRVWVFSQSETDWLLHGICSIGTQLSAGRLQTDVAVRCHLQLPC